MICDVRWIALRSVLRNVGRAISSRCWRYVSSCFFLFHRFEKFDLFQCSTLGSDRGLSFPAHNDFLIVKKLRTLTSFRLHGVIISNSSRRVFVSSYLWFSPLVFLSFWTLPVITASHWAVRLQEKTMSSMSPCAAALLDCQKVSIAVCKKPKFANRDNLNCWFCMWLYVFSDVLKHYYI